MRIVVAIIALLLPIVASAQTNPPYSPPDAELWSLLGRALDDVPMSMSAHQAVQQIVRDILREAQMREARAKAAAEAAAKATPQK